MDREERRLRRRKDTRDAVVVLTVFAMIVGSVVAVVAVGDFAFAGAIAIVFFTAVRSADRSPVSTVVAVTGLTFKFAIGICTHTSVCTVFMRTIVTVVGLGNLAFG